MLLTSREPRGPGARFAGPLACSLIVLLALAATARAQQAAQAPPPAPEPKPWMDIYGFAMLDIGPDFKRINPDWYDTMRVTKLPAFEKEFGENGNFFASVRQSRFGVKAGLPTKAGELKTRFEFDMFGVGADAGQTTIRLRYAYGELGPITAGQFESPFMDGDIFPTSLEYWGPTGMVFFRNVLVRWMPINDESQQLMFGVERPGASGDQGIYANRIELEGIRPRFPLPDFSGAYKRSAGWGYVRVGGIVRYIKWDDTLEDQFDLSGSATGWGLNVTSNVRPGKNDVIRLGLVYGEGVENYMNDAPVDIGIQNNFSNSVSPIRGKALPVLGVTAFLDHTWSPRWTSSVGYSMENIDNSDAQAPEAFKTGQYALGNLLFYPVPNVMIGGELQWGRRENFSDGFRSDGLKLQFSFKYNFNYKLGG
jgi:hypothetical protein